MARARWRGKSKERSVPYRNAEHIARFFLIDGSCCYVRPRPEEIDREASKAAGHLVLAAGCSAAKIFCREAFGSYEMRSGGQYGVPVVTSGLFYTFAPKFVGLGKGTPIDGKRAAFRFDLVPREAGYERVAWAPGFGPACLRTMRGAVHRLKQLRREPDARDDSNIDAVALARVVCEEPADRVIRRKYGTQKAFQEALREKPATTLMSIGRVCSSPSTVKINETLRKEWAPVVRRLARRALDSVRPSLYFFVGEVRGKNGWAARASQALFADLVQEGFLCLFEMAASYRADCSGSRRFDKKAYSYVMHRLREKALEGVGEEVSLDDVGADVVEACARPSSFCPRGMAVDDEVDYHAVASAGASALQRFAERGYGPERVLEAITKPEDRPISALAHAVGLPCARSLTDEGVLVRRYLELEASLASGYRRLNAVPRMSVEVST